MKIKKNLIVLSFLLVGVSSIAFHQSKAATEVRQLNVVAVETGGTKFWLPSTMIVKKGDTVKIHAVSKVGGSNNIHGFAIGEFKVEALVDEKGKDIEFIATKAGIFPIRCHLHAAHVGGQLLVLD
jgi:plastocyanin